MIDPRRKHYVRERAEHLYHAGCIPAEVTALSDGPEVAAYFAAHYPNFPERPRCRTRTPTQGELDSIVGPNLTYGSWKGITGPGKQLREAVSRINHPTTVPLCPTGSKAD